MRLTPYMYTNCHTAYESGTPVVRAMVLEYPDDPVTWDKTTQYQFMSGDWMLVAPVYTSQFIRDSIYFPDGRWIDYWSGNVYNGPQFLNDYEADINTCPVFIKEGAIIPMYPEMLYDNQLPKDPLTFDIYPAGNTSFELYEDDGLTREHRNGAYTKTIIEASGPAYGQSGPVSIIVGEYVGDYDGKPTERSYKFEVHIQIHPQNVLLDNESLPEYNSLEELEQAEEGWFFDPSDRQGIVHVKTQALNTDTSFEVLIDVLVKIGENKEKSPIKIYPNPTGGSFEIISSKADIIGIRLIDMGGNEITLSENSIYSGKKASVTLNSAIKGVYIVEVNTEEGIFKDKLILQ
jgi:hypothetical protein